RPFAAEIVIRFRVRRVVQTVVARARKRIDDASRKSEAVTELAVAAAKFEHKAVIFCVSERTDPRRFFDRLIGTELCDGRESNADRRSGRVKVLSDNGNRRLRA